jgi:hypothetical protein
MKVVSVINQLVLGSLVRAGLAFICAARVGPPHAIIDVAQHRPLHGWVLDTIASNKEV